MKTTFLFFGSDTERMDDIIIKLLRRFSKSQSPDNLFYFINWNKYNSNKQEFHTKVKQYFQQEIFCENNLDTFNNILSEIKPEIIYILNGTNLSIPDYLLQSLFNNKREYRIIEVNLNGNLLETYIPDLVLNFSYYPDEEKNYKKTIQFPKTHYYPVSKSTVFSELNLDSTKFHIVIPEEINGRNNQKEILYHATLFQDKNINDVVFHFVGETVHYNRLYWQPITEAMKYLNNCYFWNGKVPQYMFYSIADLILFTSHEKYNEFFLFETEDFNVPILTNYFSNTEQQKLQKEQYKENFEKIYNIYKDLKK